MKSGGEETSVAFPSLINLVVSVDVKYHVYLLTVWPYHKPDRKVNQQELTLNSNVSLLLCPFVLVNVRFGLSYEDVLVTFCIIIIIIIIISASPGVSVKRLQISNGDRWCFLDNCTSGRRGWRRWQLLHHRCSRRFRCHAVLVSLYYAVHVLSTVSWTKLLSKLSGSFWSTDFIWFIHTDCSLTRHMRYTDCLRCNFILAKWCLHTKVHKGSWMCFFVHTHIYTFPCMYMYTLNLKFSTS